MNVMLTGIKTKYIYMLSTDNHDYLFTKFTNFSILFEYVICLINWWLVAYRKGNFV